MCGPSNVRASLSVGHGAWELELSFLFIQTQYWQSKTTRWQKQTFRDARECHCIPNDNFGDAKIGFASQILFTIAIKLG